MTGPDDALWKRRFLIFMSVRLVGLLVFVAGLGIAFSDLLRPGGWPALGLGLAAMGALDTVFAPRLLKAYWDREDKQRRQ